MSTHSRLTDLRRRQIEENEARVLALGALEAERIRAVLRVVLATLLPLAMVLGSYARGTVLADPVRALFAGLYLAFAVVMLFKLRTFKPSVRGATFGPLALTLTDFGMMWLMSIRSVQAGDTFKPMITALVCAVFLAFSATRVSLLHVAVSTAAAIATYLSAAAYAGTLVSGGESFGAVVGFLMLGGVAGLANRQTRRMLVDLRRRDNLMRLLPRRVAERVMQQGGVTLEPVLREVTVLFVDVRDFTSLSEKLSPRQVLEFLNGVLGELSQIVEGRDGVVNKFLGDGMLAVWGVPERTDQHAQLAVRAALDMLRAVEERNRLPEHAAAPLRIGIGVHTGTVAAGMLGGPEQHEYTVIGDAVNLASRIEGLTKSFGVPLLVSATTWEKLGGSFEGRRLGDAQVKGRDEKVTVYAVDAAAPREAA